VTSGDDPIVVQLRPLLVSGMVGLDMSILIDNEQPLADQNLALWHELVHWILISQRIDNHDESLVETAAQRLAKTFEPLQVVGRI